MFRLVLTVFIIAILISSCMNAGNDSSDFTPTDDPSPAPTEGINMSIRTSTSGASSFVTSGSQFSAQSYQAPQSAGVTGVGFRASDLAMWHVDPVTIMNDVNAARTAATETVVRMELEEWTMNMMFAADGANSRLPIDQSDLGAIKNLKYNLININIGGGKFYYLTSDAGDYYQFPGTDIRIMGVDYVHVSNILLVDQALWDTVKGTSNAGIALYENGDRFISNQTADVPNFVEQGTDSINPAPNPLLQLVSHPDYDVSGCIVYPIENAVDLTSYTVLENGYANIDPSEIKLDIALDLAWDMPTSVEYELLVDPSDYSPLYDAVCVDMFEDDTKRWDDIDSDNDGVADDPDDQWFVDDMDDTLDWMPIYNRYVVPPAGGHESRYDFNVSVSVTEVTD